ncbi:glycosyl hydrolase [Bizionia saleffrena]|uniref:Glycosyl hydrolase n=1 Tax=Bizionia saleffrena TaxID=291189 RepID=A0A8H2QEC5_9FLAO|nr:sialidase family protein [Bizionia saleffrena]TYB71789.1 glycosyl hydrolase [Bizionia saleffrena]
MMFRIFLMFLFTSMFSVSAQQVPTTADAVKESLIQKEKLHKQSLVKNLAFETIGPKVMSGRVVDVEVNPENNSEFYVGYASGGVWYTANNGSSFKPVLDSAPTQNVGDIAVDWKTKTIWVGTGENNSSRSSYAGIGILKSTNQGVTWENMGLKESHHIGRIIIDSNHPETVIVGVTGHLYSNNKERGIYKTTDGGTTWEQKLFINDSTGIIDIDSPLNNTKILYASSWTRDRKAWNFSGSGTGSAIYKSNDSGENWSKVTVANSGFPVDDGVGRIGLAVFNEDIVYALLDNQNRRPPGDADINNNSFNTMGPKAMPGEDFLKLSDKKINAFLKTNGFREKYRAENVKQIIRSGLAKPSELTNFLKTTNAMLFETPVIGAEVYKSIDGGKSWAKTHNNYIDDLYYSYGYYFGEIRVDLQDENGIYVLGVPILKSKDGGKTFKNISQENVHADHQALWVSPNKQGHLIDGNDGGLNMSYDDGATWEKLNVNAVGQFYAINVDNQTPYNVYGGLQDNGVWFGPHNAKHDRSWNQSGHYPWEGIMGGDGMKIEIDNRNPDIIYTGYQFGNYYRIDREKESQTYIQPKPEEGGEPYRFNWQTPILLSQHNQDILYFGGNKVMRSLNQGTDWDVISPDLTQGGKTGNVAYGTLTTMSESPFQFGLIYTGSDDGLLHVTKNGGATWKLINNTLPKDLWVSRVVASKYKKERVYATLNGYRFDDFKSYVYVSDNYGETWSAINSNLPVSAVNVIVEDENSASIIYLGTDNGAYVSFNTGESWEAFVENLPAVAVHDMVIHKESNDLLLATHGRSIYKTNVSQLQKMTADSLQNEVVIFPFKTVKHSPRWGDSYSQWSNTITPELEIAFYSHEGGDKAITISSKGGKVVKTISKSVDKGYNVLTYNLSISEKIRAKLLKKDTSISIEKAKNNYYYLPKGNYVVKIDGAKETFVIE